MVNNKIAYVRLVGVGKPAHSAHDAQHVVVHGVDTHGRGQYGAHGVVGQGQQQGRVINAREVAAAAGLVFLGLQRKAVHVHAHRGDVGVVLVGLHQVEVLAFTLLEAIVAVQLDLGRHNGVVARQALHAGHGVARLQHRAVPPVGVVEGLLSLPGVDDGVIAAHERVALYNPHEFLSGVVEVHLDLVGAGGHRLATSELQLLDQVLVGDLREAAALIRIQVDVIHEQRRRYQARSRHAITDHVGVGGVAEVPAQIGQHIECQPDLHLVILERDQRQRQTRVAAEPELQGDVQSVLRRALLHLRDRIGFHVGGTVVVAALAALYQQIHQLGHVAHHLGVAGLLARLLSQLIPDVHPVTIMLIDLLAADLHIHVGDQVVAHPVEPAELRTRAIAGLEHHLRQCGLQVHTVDQITVTADGALYFLTKVRGAIEGLFNGLHREVGVTAVDDLEDKVLPSLSGNFGAVGPQGLDYNLSKVPGPYP